MTSFQSACKVEPCGLRNGGKGPGAPVRLPDGARGSQHVLRDPQPPLCHHAAGARHRSPGSERHPRSLGSTIWPAACRAEKNLSGASPDQSPASQQRTAPRLKRRRTGGRQLRMEAAEGPTWERSSAWVQGGEVGNQACWACSCSCYPCLTVEPGPRRTSGGSTPKSTPEITSGSGQPPYVHWTR